MSFVFRRSLSTLIPPKVASATNISSNPTAKRMQNIVSFYEKLPRGNASFKKGSGPIAAYRAKYFDGENASGAPVFHLAVGLLFLGYSLEYYFHLRHHKEH